VRLLPTVLKTVTAPTEINAAIRPYSIAVAAVWSRHRSTMVLNMFLPLKEPPCQSCLPADCQFIKPLRCGARGLNPAGSRQRGEHRFGGYRGDVGRYRAAHHHINPQASPLRLPRQTVLRRAIKVTKKLNTAPNGHGFGLAIPSAALPSSQEPDTYSAALAPEKDTLACSIALGR
jgi:hypothetical protein